MTKTLTFLISFCFLICSCNDPKTTKDNATQSNSTNDKSDIVKLNDVLKKYEEPSQVIKVSADKPTVVTGRKGTRILINPDDLITESGKPLGPNIEVELKELNDQGELLTSNAQTVCDGKLLVSGGAYFIGMTSNGEQLKLKDGKTLRVQFPKLSDNEMALFYGQRNELGQMNWQKATETFKATQKQTKPVADSAKRKPIGKNRKSDIESIMNYVDSGDTTTTQGDRDAMVKREKAYKEYEANQRVYDQLYDQIGINKLGWINCDRFLEIREKADLYARFNPKDSVTNANIFLVFKDINSVVQAYYYPDISPRFENIPIGYKARLIAYTVKDQKVFAFSSDLTIAKEQKLTLNLKEINDKDFKKLIGD